MHNPSMYVACMQLCSSDNMDENLAAITHTLTQYDTTQVQLLVLPENAVLLTDQPKLKQQAAQPETYTQVLNYFSKLAKAHHLWLIAGSILVQHKKNPQKYFNQCPVFSPEGKLIATYNKMHLFDVDLGNESWQESASISAGDTPISVDMSNTWKVGLSICYDLRFPELYRAYSKQDCNIFSVPAAFTVPTGKAHWETLLKARAIENQAYILAAGQWGKHQDERETYGHSCIINPWGEVLTEIEAGEGLITAQLDNSFLDDLKKRMPVLKHRRIV